MNTTAARMQALARRFLELAPPARQHMLERLRQEHIDFSILPIPARPAKDVRVRASYAQQRLWFAWNLDRSSPAYNLTGLIRLTGPLHLNALRDAFSDLIARHEALRTTFTEAEGQTFQLIQPERPFELPCVDLASMTPAVQDEQTQTLTEADATAPFDLEHGPLIRARLLRLGEREHLLVITLHHITCDGWSLQIALKELAQCYAARRQGLLAPLAPLPIQYADYAVWQRHWLEAGELQRQLAYWRAHLGDHHPVLNLPTDRLRPARVSYAGASVELQLDESLTQRLRTFARARNATLFMVLLAAFKTVLYRYTGETDIRVGAPVANRTRLETEQLIGFFVNTQVLRTVLTGSESFSDLLRQVKRIALDAQAHQDLPFEQLVDAIGPQRHLAYHPLFQVKFTLHVVSEQARQAADLQFELVGTCPRHTHFDLSLDIFESERTLRASFTYAADLFDRDTIERLGAHLDTLLRGALNDPDTAIDDLPLVTVPEHAALTSDGNAPDASPATDVIALFDDVARRTPQLPAVRYEERTLSYRDLDRASRELAQRLRERGVRREQAVVVCCERSPELVVAMVGVLRAGAVWVPVDPRWPLARIQFVVRNCAARCVLVSGGDRSRWQEAGAELVLVDDIAAKERFTPVSPAAGDANIGGDVAEMAVHLSQAAYIVYTSGSTGAPKGVVITRGAIANYVQGVLRRFVFAPDASMALVSTVAADLGFTMLFGALCSGRLLHVVSDRDSFDAERFAAYMRRHAVGILKIVPSHIAGLLKAAQPADVLPRHAIILGGEASSWSLLETIRRHRPECRIVNHYGPTETTVGVLTHETVALRERGQTAPIGRPLPNAQAYILDARLAPVPAGLPGELYLGGAGMARGYLGRPDLTAERFTPDPYGGKAGARLYRTGDRARIHGNGQIEFLGRLDQQIKVRGYRVEPEEIAHVLRELPGVAQAVVVARQLRTGESPERWHLIGYFVPAPGHDPHPDELQSALMLRLPDHMVPAVLVCLQSLHVTPNGKLDLAALPVPDLQQDRAQYEAPSGVIETTLARIWAEVIGLERVGVRDNFFKLGGDSILSLQIISRARKQDIRLTPQQLFEHQTIRALAEQLASDAAQPLEQAPASVGSATLGVRTRANTAADLTIPTAGRNERLSLSPAQRRLWVLWKLEPDKTAYNIVASVKLAGWLRIEVLRKSFDALLTRHEILRTVFPEDAQGAYQLIRSRDPIDTTWRFESQCVSGGMAGVIERVKQAASEPFDLAGGPLLRVALLRLGEQEHVLIVSMHHIVSDGWSMNVLVDEFTKMYEALSRGKAPTLPVLSVQYADYAAWQQQWLDTGEGTRQLAFWRERLGCVHPVLELPTDRPRPLQHSGRGATLQWRVADHLLAALKAYTHSRQASLFMLLLAAFKVLLFRYTGQHELRVGVPVANRGRIETERLIGFFVNTLVLHTDVSDNPSFEDLLQRLTSHVLQAQLNQDLPFEELVQVLNPPRSLSVNPLFQVMHSHQRRDWPTTGVQVDALHIEPLPHDSPTTQFDLTLDTVESAGGLTAAFTYSTDLFDHVTIEQLARHWQQILHAAVECPHTRIGLLPMLTDSERQQAIGDWQDTELAQRLSRSDAADATKGATRVYLLDEHLELVPTGVIGEICVAGAAFGITHRSDAAHTALAWVPNRFGEPGERVCRTGDHGRYRRAGHIEYVVQHDSEAPRHTLPISQAKGAVRIAPRTEVERVLAGVWQDALGIDEVGVHDNFFHLGGDSIIAIQVVDRARSRGVGLSPRDLFQHQTLAELAAAARRATPPVSVDEPSHGEIELTPIQHWFFEQAIAVRNHWNQSVLLEADGHLDGALIERAMRRLVEHHDVLRMRFRVVDGRHRQILDASPQPALCSCVDATRMPELSWDETMQWAQRSLDLESGPLLHAVVVHMAPNTSRLLLVAHHLVIDGVSWRILLDDLDTLYRQMRSGESPALPSKTMSFARWSHLLQGYALSESLQREARYWREVAAEPSTPLPAHDPHGANTVDSAQKLEISLSESETLQLLRRAPLAYRTQVNDLLLTALACALCEWSGHADAFIELEGHGREELFDGIDLTRTLGWFTTLYPVRLEPGSSDPGNAIRAVKEQLRRVPNRGLGYGVLRYLSPRSEHPFADHRPSVTFNYLGQVDQGLRQRSQFRPVDGYRGEERDLQSLRTNLLDISAIVLGGSLRLSIAYSRHIHREAQIEDLMRRYSAHLRRVIAHCLSDGVRGLSPADFPLASLTQAQLDALPWPAAEIEDIYALSPMQQGMLFHCLLDPASGLYVNQQTAEVSAPLNVALFEQAWHLVFDAYETLRSAFWWKTLDRPVQILKRNVAAPFAVHDWTDRSGEQQQHDLSAWLEAERSAGFDLTAPPLIRVSVILLDEGRTQLVWTDHHLLLDGWSSTQLLTDVLRCYASLMAGESAQIVAPPRYRTYVAWLQSQQGQNFEQFWRATLHAFDTPSLLSHYQAPKFGHVGYGVLERILPQDIEQSVRNLTKRHGLTFSTVIQGAVALWLSVQSQRPDVLFGVTVSGRNMALAGIERMPGMFINTLPLRAHYNSEISAIEWLRALQAHGIEMREYEYAALVELQAYSGVPRGTSLFDTLLIITNYPVDPALADFRRALQLDNVYSHDRNNYPLSIAVVPNDRIDFKVGFDTRYFDAGSVEELAVELFETLKLLVAHPEALLGQITAPLQHLRMRRLDQMPADATGPWPASIAQEERWVAGGAESSEALVLSLTLQGPLDAQSLQTAFKGLLERHPGLRMRLFENDRQLYQDIDLCAPLALEIQDLSAEPDAQQKERVRLCERAQRARGLKPDRGPLLRATWLKCASLRHVLVLTVSTLACDCESATVLARDLLEFLDSTYSARAPRLPACTVWYANHALWERRQLASKGLPLLRDDAEPDAVSAARAAPEVTGKELTIDLGADFSQSLAAFGVQHPVSVLAMVSGAAALALEADERTGWRLDVEISEPPSHLLRGVVGVFRRTKKISTDVAHETDCISWLRALAADIAVQVPAWPERKSVSSVLRVAVEDYPDQLDAGTRLRADAFEVYRGAGGVGPLIRLVRRPRAVSLNVQYRSDLPDQESLEWMARALAAALRAMVDQPGSTVAQLRTRVHEVRLEWLSNDARWRGQRMRVSRSARRHSAIPDAATAKGNVP